MRRGLVGVGVAVRPTARLVMTLIATLVIALDVGLAMAAPRGGAWKRQPVPGRRAALLGVSCFSAARCVAVGERDPSSVQGLTVAALWNGRRWSSQSTPNPPGTPENTLRAVSCRSATRCIAVGESDLPYEAGSFPLAERWNGHRWTTEPAPVSRGRYADFSEVSCVPRGVCMAVGEYLPNPGRPLPFAERWNGRRWSVQRVQLPPYARDAMLRAVSCVSGKVCVAVGVAQLISNARFVPLAERWDGRHWFSQRIPDPGRGGLNGVSCVSPFACTAVGGTLHRTLAEQWQGDHWAVQRTRNPAGTASHETINALLDVSCPSVIACTAVGAAGKTPATAGPLVEQWTGTHWNVERSAQFGHPQNDFLDGVSCVSIEVCTAVGNFDSIGGPSLPLAERRY